MTALRNYSFEPTARGDQIAEEMRDYYEANREGWIDRWRKRWAYTSDNLMLGLLNVALAADARARREDEEQ